MNNKKPKKNVLITGGSSGIGYAIANHFAKQNCRLILLARDKQKLQRAQQHLIDEYGIEVDVHDIDLRVQAAVEQFVSAVDKIDVLVNNAGICGGGKTAAMDDTLWHDVINSNLHTVYYLTKACLNQQKLTKPGRIINIASTGGKQGVVYGAAYSAAKHGVVGFTKALGLELARQHITVNAVCPGFVETEMASRVRENYAKIWQTTPEETRARIEQRVPMGRYILPEEVASMVGFIASEQAAGITAQAINVCGGLGNY